MKDDESKAGGSPSPSPANLTNASSRQASDPRLNGNAKPVRSVGYRPDGSREFWLWLATCPYCHLQHSHRAGATGGVRHAHCRGGVYQIGPAR